MLADGFFTTTPPGEQISLYLYVKQWAFPGGASGEESASWCRKCKWHGFDPWVGKIPWSRKWHHTAALLPGKFNGQRSPTGYSPWGHKNTTADPVICFARLQKASRSYSEHRLLRENKHVQWTLEQHGPEPCRSTYMQSFSLSMVLRSQHEVESVLVDGRCRGQLWCLVFCGCPGYQGTTVSGFFFFFYL